jgi:hypothetical protein
MPVLLIPSSYVEGETKCWTAGEAEGKDTKDVMVETTMGEVRFLLLLSPTFPSSRSALRYRSLVHLKHGTSTDFPPALYLAVAQLLPLSFGPEDLDKPRDPSSSSVATGEKV